MLHPGLSVCMDCCDIQHSIALNSHFPCAPVTVAAVQLYEESLQDAPGNLPGPATDVFWQFSAPAGLRSLLAWVTKRYQRPELWVTESGMAVVGEANMTKEAALNDEPRLEFFRYTTGRGCSSRGGQEL